MKIVAIVLAIVLLYITFSTWFQDTTYAGSIGTLIGQNRVDFLGYVAYADTIVLLIVLAVIIRRPDLRRSLDFYLGLILSLIAVVLLQALVVVPEKAGLLGNAIVSFLLPYIGKAGVWLFWLMIVSLVASLAWETIKNIGGKLRTLRPKGKRATVSFDEIEQERRKHRDQKEKKPSVMKRLKQNPFAAPQPQTKDPFLEETAVSHTPVRRKKAMPEITAPEEKKPTASLQAVSSKPKSEVSAQKKTSRKDIEKPTGVTSSQSVEQNDETAQESIADIDVQTESQPVSNIQTTHVPIVEELEENKKLLADIETGKREQPIDFILPKLDFLQRPPKRKKRVNEAEIDRKSGVLLEKLKLFNIQGDIVRTYTGPLVTTFEFKPAPNVKVSKILNLQDDLAMALSAETIRIQAPIPGRDVVGIEIPNDEREIIYLREILESEIFQDAKSPLTVALGKDIVGNPFLTDIQKLPHLLIAGTTGSGKSVGINAMILSLLYKNDPDRLKLMMIDPKMLEFAIYDDIPHLITPVITEPKQAIAALANMVGEMERRYKMMAQMRTKNIDTYNEKVKRTGEGEPMPFIVVIIDELADLMMNGGKEVENSIARLAQKSRACGIHLIVATQRPSVDVVTGIIKANLPSRLSYRVGQKIDSKVILDSLGAESLLGRGDGLFTPPASNGLVRIHAPWATEEEIETIVEFIKAQRAPQYDESYLIEGGGVSSGDGGDGEIDLDPLYEEAKQIILTDKKTSISYLQRKLQIGYNRAANLIEQLEKTGVLSAPNAKGVREIIG